MKNRLPLACAAVALTFVALQPPASATTDSHQLSKLPSHCRAFRWEGNPIYPTQVGKHISCETASAVSKKMAHYDFDWRGTRIIGSWACHVGNEYEGAVGVEGYCRSHSHPSQNAIVAGYFDASIYADGTGKRACTASEMRKAAIAGAENSHISLIRWICYRGTALAELRHKHTVFSDVMYWAVNSNRWEEARTTYQISKYAFFDTVQYNNDFNVAIFWPLYRYFEAHKSAGRP